MVLLQKSKDLFKFINFFEKNVDFLLIFSKKYVK